MIQRRITDLESAVRSLKAARPFELDLHRLGTHPRMAQEDLGRVAASSPNAPTQEALDATEAGNCGPARDLRASPE